MSKGSRLLTYTGLAALLGKGFTGNIQTDPPEPEPKDPPEPSDPPEPKPEPTDPPEPKDPPEPIDPPEATVDTVLASDAVRAAGEARAQGFAAANARMKAVLESKEGKANLDAAVFLLCNSEASAEACIAHLATLPPQTGISATTPKIDLTGGKPGVVAADVDKPGGDPEAADTTKLWAGVQQAHNAMTAGGVNLAG